MNEGRAEIIEVDTDLVRETDKAFLLRSDGGTEIWLPKSRVHYDKESGQLLLPLWMAENEGLV